MSTIQPFLNSMQTEIPAQALAAIATIIGALIAGFISFVNLTLNKEQKTSEFRQAWIDGLRDDLSQFLSAVRSVARAEEGFFEHGENFSNTNFPASSEQIHERRQIAMETLYRIKLRLNIDEDEHKELLRLLDRCIAEQQKISSTVPSSEAAIRAIDIAADYARPVLKAEWKRVKSGELPFRLVRNWIAPFTVVLCIAFIALLATGKFKI